LLDLDGTLTGRRGDVVVSANNITLNNPSCRLDPSFLRGIACSNTKNWIRFAFNQVKPELADLVNITDVRNQTVTSPKLRKRLTHPFGYMFSLEANQAYYFEFDQTLNPTNLSYTGVFYGLAPGEYVIVQHRLLKKPDQVYILNSQQPVEQSFQQLGTNSNNSEWTWDEENRILSYIISNKAGRVPFLDVAVAFNAIKCRYTGCRLPTQPALRLPATQRPSNALYWSNNNTWRIADYGWGGYGGVLPKDNDRIKIPDGYWVVVDVELPKLKILQIDGVLEFNDSLDNRLEAEIIFINGGQLIVGWENDTFEHNMEIVLNGEKSDANFYLPNGFDSIGVKGIGVYGGLDLHGKPRNRAWTTLATTARAGQSSIRLKEPVDWQTGEEIVITSTSFLPEQAETLIIANVSADRLTLNLSSSLMFDHIGFSESLPNNQSYTISAGVGLLSRNVRIVAAEYAKQEADLYGSRMLVSDYSAMVDLDTFYYKGYARLSNVEFARPGQFSRNSEDDNRYGILFSNLGEYNYARPSYVKSCTFHHGYSAAIGIFGSASIPIVNNVVYKTLDFGFRIEGHSNIIRNNLLILNYWGSTFVPWEAPFDIEYWGAIDVHLAETVVLEDNFVGGSQRIGIFYKGDVCSGGSLGVGKNHSIKRNTVYSSLAGVAILPTFAYSNLNCVRMSGFTVFKSSHWALYYQGEADLLVDSNQLIDNQVNVFSMIIRPPSITHELENKTANIANSLIVGQSSSFDCSKDIKPNDLNFRMAKTVTSYGSGSNELGKIGIVWAQFMSGPNGAPYKPW
jgi:hypothetical protein